MKWNLWDKMLEDIKAQEAVLESVEELWRDAKYHEQIDLSSANTMDVAVAICVTESFLGLDRIVLVG